MVPFWVTRALRPSPSSQPLATGLDLLLAVVIFVAACGGYWLTRPAVLSGDDLQYLMGVRQTVDRRRELHPAETRRGPGLAAPPTRAPSALVVNPRYVLDQPLAVMATRGARLLDSSLDPAGVVMGVRNLAGAAGLALFFLAVRAAEIGRAAAFVAAAGLGASQAYWVYSVHPDQTIVAVAANLAAIFAALRVLSGAPGGWNAPLMITSLILGTLFNLVSGLLAGVLIAITAARAKTPRAGVAIAGRYGALYALVVAGSVVCAIAVVVPRALLEAEYWSSARFEGHPQYAFAPLEDGIRAVFGLSKSLLHFPGDGDSIQSLWRSGQGPSQVGLAVWSVVAISIVAGSVLLALRRADALRSGPARALLIGTGVMATTGVFGWWWEPANFKYWVMPLVGWWLIVATQLGRLLAGCERRGWRLAALGTLVVGLGAANFTWGIDPARDLSRYPWPSIAAALGDSAPEALFVSAGHPVDFHVAYYARRDVVSINLIAYDRPTHPDDVLERVRDRLERQRAAGLPVYVYGLNERRARGTEAALDWLEAQPRSARWVLDGLTVEELR
jgi:hypothetical protein